MSYTTIINHQELLKGKRILYAIVDQTNIRESHADLFNKMYEMTYQMTKRLSVGTLLGTVKYFCNIDQAMDYSNLYDIVILQSVGNFINRNKFFIEVDNYVRENPDFFILAFTLDWHSEKGYGYIECHHQLMVINVNIWKKIGRPMFGTWEDGEKELPNYSRSNENFHDNYTPYWIKGEPGFTKHNKVSPGWNFLKIALEKGYRIDNFSEDMRACRLYIYPEFESENLYKGIKSKNHELVNNPNQKKWIKNMFNTSLTVWIFNSEIYRFQTDMESYDTYIGPASGFKYLDYLNYRPNGKFVFYDINQKALDWIKNLQENWDGEDFYNYLQKSPEEDKKHFKFIYGKKLNKETIDKNLNVLYQDLGGKSEFQRLWNLFKTSETKFIKTDILNPTDLENLLLESKTKLAFFNFSNIFATDFTLLDYTIAEIEKKYDNFLNAVSKAFIQYTLYGSNIDGNWQTLHNIPTKFTPSSTDNYVESFRKKEMNRMTSAMIKANIIDRFSFIDVGCSGGILQKLRNFEPVLKGLGVDPLVEECSRLHNLEENSNIKYIPAYVAATGSTHPTGFNFWRTYVGNLQKQAKEFNEGSNGKQ